MSSVPCPTCGGALPEVLYRRMVTCTYCSASHPNPGCLRAGDEVLLHGGVELDLARVQSCTGPDAITIGDTLYKLEDLIPVTRATATLPSGTGVYLRGPMGWAFTYTASAPDGPSVKVKNSNAGFQDSFFDQAALLDDLRLDARPADAGGMHVRRTKLGALLARFRQEPVAVLFDYGVTLFIGTVFLIIAVFAIRMFLF